MAATTEPAGVLERVGTYFAVRGGKRRAHSARPPSTANMLLLVVLCTAAYFVPRGLSWNADTHLFLTASIVDRGSLNIDPLARFTGDVAFSHGHYYADKAPGLSLLAVPVYAVLKYTLMGGQPYTAVYALPQTERIDFLVRYVLAVVFSAVPTGLICALLYRFLARFGVRARWRVGVALTYALGTMARPFAGQFFSHQLAALLVFGGFIVVFRLRRREVHERLAVVAGVLLGYAVITEYPVALIAGAIGIYALGTPERGRGITGKLALGAVPPVLVGALYNTLAFGGPLSQGYAHLAGPEVFRVGQAQGFLGITYPHLDALWQTTFGPYRGMLLLSPVLLLAVPGFVALWRMRAWRAETLLWLSIVVVYFLFTISYFEWDGGFSIGPRQFLPALPFLMLPIGVLLRPGLDRRWQALATLLAVYSVVVVGTATAVGALFDPVYSSPLTQWVVPRLVGYSLGPAQPAPSAAAVEHAVWSHVPLFSTARLDNNWGMLFHLSGLLQLLPLWVLLAAVVLWHWRAVRQHATLAAGVSAGEQS